MGRERDRQDERATEPRRAGEVKRRSNGEGLPSPMSTAPVLPPITFTFDLEEHRARPTSPPRYRVMTERVLDFLDGLAIKGTFFIVGDVVEAAPDLVRAIAARGHEVGSHSYRHAALAAESPRVFKTRIIAAKQRLEDVAGRRVLGFRAPMLSLTPATSWTADILAQAGFVYSSSVLPAANFLHGFPAAPREPFLWPSGLLEIPCPVARAGRFLLPFLGGMYLRYLPPWRLRSMTRQMADGVYWLYCHPYDFDVDEPFGRAVDRGLLAGLFLWCNRRHTFRRVEALLAGRSSEPFEARLAELTRRARPFSPPRSTEAPQGVAPEPAQSYAS